MIDLMAIECEICGYKFGIEKYGSGLCPRCNQEYFHDNDCYRTELTKLQTKTLWDHKEEWGR
jgi:hypothetical protein